jgi:hypothetical protein
LFDVGEVLCEVGKSPFRQLEKSLCVGPHLCTHRHRLDGLPKRARGLAGVRRECGDVDEGGHVLLRPGLRDHRTSIGMADQYDRWLGQRDRPPQRGDVTIKPG